MVVTMAYMTPVPEPEPTLDEMSGVDRYPWGATEPDEEAVLGKNYGYDAKSGTYTSHVGD